MYLKALQSLIGWYGLWDALEGARDRGRARGRGALRRGPEGCRGRWS